MGLLRLASVSALRADNKKPAEAGFLPDHSNLLLAASLAMVDRP
jgi:hypothetical protein